MLDYILHLYVLICKCYITWYIRMLYIIIYNTLFNNKLTAWYKPLILTFLPRFFAACCLSAKNLCKTLHKRKICKIVRNFPIRRRNVAHRFFRSKMCDINHIRRAASGPCLAARQAGTVSAVHNILPNTANSI